MKKKSMKSNIFNNNFKLLIENHVLKDNKYIPNISKKVKLIYILIIFLILTHISLILYKIIFLKYPIYNNLKNYFIKDTYRLAFVFGTRPEAIKLFPLIKQLKNNSIFRCIIINTGQHKEMIKQILKSLDMDDSIDFNLNIMKKNQSLAELTSKVISELDNIYNLIDPNAVIVQGDTTTSFSAAITAFYRKIPIFHVEAGLRTHNIYFPFPEEFNRVTIDDLSTLYFAPTDWSANNLLKENKISSNIFITGNTIVDSLKLTLNKTNPSKYIKNILEKAKLSCLPETNCKIILLTCHRRENYYKPIYNIINAVQKLLKEFQDIIIIFPLHMNPNIRQSIKEAISESIFDNLIKGEIIKQTNYSYLNRFKIISPLNYIDLIHLECTSYLIMSDSGGIQEEAVSIGKPILILRENTERPEAVESGCAFLVGTSSNTIYHYAKLLLENNNLYKNMSYNHNIYGFGNSSRVISNIIHNYFKKIENKSSSSSFNITNFNNILYQYDKSILINDNTFISNYKNNIYDIVIVLTVWKRNNLERQLIQIKNQSIIKNKKTNIIIFQNSNHTNIKDIVEKWNKTYKFSYNVDITFIQSPIETGYFGRFIIPLTSSVNDNTYFIICDDDVIWGNRYFENMIRVVNQGSLATRNGRIITENFGEEIKAFTNENQNKQICYNEDIEYDFGGHIWAGRISWLRKAWNHIPVSLEHSEDFWLSAVLKVFYNITTKSPKCPCPKGKPITPDLCAASDTSALNHNNAIIGEYQISQSTRDRLIKEITLKYNYQRLISTKPEYVKNISELYFHSDTFFNLSDLIWKDALWWQ
mgnify:CR=1 FL=1